MKLAPRTESGRRKKVRSLIRKRSKIRKKNEKNKKEENV
jgi:hypothetical protein